MEKVFLTGADGFLGSNITRMLLASSYEVIAFTEEDRNAETIRNLNKVTIKTGDILNVQSIIKAMEGCDFVIHAAASTSISPARSAFVRKINIEGTQNVIQAALHHEVKRMIHIGSANTFGYGSMEKPGDETKPYACAKFKSDYMDSKRAAHAAILDAVHKNNLPAIILCPTFMLGSFDTKPSSGAMVAALYSEKLPGYSGGGRNYIYVKDVAQAVANALKKGKVGEAYILGNKNMDYRTAFQLIAHTIGVSAPKMLLPSWAAKFYGGYGSLMYQLFGKTPTVDYVMAMIACEGFYYASDKAIKALDLPQTPIEVAIKKSFDWLEGNNLLPLKENKHNVAKEEKIPGLQRKSHYNHGL